MPDYDADTLPTTDDPGGPCPRCGRTSSFVATVVSELRYFNDDASKAAFERAAELVCRGCSRGTIVIEARDTLSGPWTPVMWWPIPGAGTLDESVPEPVRKAYDEGVRCLAIQVPNAAAAMLRSALAQIVQDTGSEDAKKKGTLNDALAQMVKDGSLHPTFEDWAAHIRRMGNAGAHPEKFGEVSQADAEELQRLIYQLLQVLYVQPAAIRRARDGGAVSKRAAPSTGASTVDH